MTFSTPAKKLFYEYFEWSCTNYAGHTEWMRGSQSHAYIFDMMVFFYRLQRCMLWGEIAPEIIKFIRPAWERVSAEQVRRVVLCVDLEAVSVARQYVAQVRREKSDRTPRPIEDIGPLEAEGLIPDHDFIGCFLNRQWRFEKFYPFIMDELIRLITVPINCELILHGFRKDQTHVISHNNREPRIYGDLAENIRMSATEADLSTASFEDHMRTNGWDVTLQSGDGDVLPIAMLSQLRRSSASGVGQLMVHHGYMETDPKYVVMERVEQQINITRDELSAQTGLKVEYPIMDWVALLFLTGNDYVPAVSSITPHKLVSAYCKANLDACSLARPIEIKGSRYWSVQLPALQGLLKHAYLQASPGGRTPARLNSGMTYNQIVDATNTSHYPLPSPARMRYLASNLEFCLNYFFGEPVPTIPKMVLMPPGDRTFYGYGVNRTGTLERLYKLRDEEAAGPGAPTASDMEIGIRTLKCSEQEINPPEPAFDIVSIAMSTVSTGRDTPKNDQPLIVDHYQPHMT